MALSNSRDVKPGDRVTVSSFEAVIAQATLGPEETVQVMEVAPSIPGSDFRYTHNIALSQLDKVLPYEDGAEYLDANNVRFTWNAAGRNWSDRNGRTRSFSDPARPLRKVTLGDPVTDTTPAK